MPSWKRAALVHLLLSPVLFAIPACGQFSNAPGFGTLFTRKKVVLRRKLPPVVNVAGKNVTVSMEGHGALQQELQSALENLLTRSDSNVQVGGSHPDLVVDVAVAQYGTPKVTTTTQNNVTTQTYSGSLSTTFRISDPSSGHVVRSGVATTQIEQPSQANNLLHIPLRGSQPAPGNASIKSTLDVENALVADVAHQIASYLVITDESVEVLLASGGSLNSPDKLAMTNLWPRDLEELETLPAFGDPRTDAYRQYNIGVANEALAYQAQDAKAAVKFLQQASIDYGKALANRPDEKFFLEPQNRIKTALAHYDAGPANTANAAPERSAPASAAAENHGLSNDDVVAMVQAHMDQANILDNIQSAPKVSFDLSVPEQVKLLHAGVNNQLLAAMKQKARSSAGTSAGH